MDDHGGRPLPPGPALRGPDRGPNARPGRRRARPPSPEPAVHRLYVHLAWTTLDRLPLIGTRRAPLVEAHLIALCRRLDVEPMQARARRDRVDLLVRLKPVHAVARVARRLKEGSAQLLTEEGTPVRWARGYAVATVAPREVRGWIRRHAHGPRTRGSSRGMPVDAPGSDPLV